jgi:hypothetical protein
LGSSPLSALSPQSGRKEDLLEPLVISLRTDGSIFSSARLAQIYSGGSRVLTLVQRWVDESNRSLANKSTLLVEECNYGSKDRRRKRSTEVSTCSEVHEGKQEGSVGRHIWVSTTNTVINTAILANVGSISVDLVIWQRLEWEVFLEVVGDSLGLVGWWCEVIGKTPACSEEVVGRAGGSGASAKVEGGQVDLHGGLGVVDSLVRVESGGSHGGDIGASGGVVWVVDSAVHARSAQAAFCVIVATREACDTVITAGYENGVATKMVREMVKAQ